MGEFKDKSKRIGHSICTILKSYVYIYIPPPFAVRRYLIRRVNLKISK